MKGSVNNDTLVRCKTLPPAPYTARRLPGSLTTASVRPARAKILVVDDEPMIGSVARRLLTRRGYDVTVTQGADEALALLEASDGAFDLVITDWWMPGMCGRELVARLQSRWPWIPVMVMSGSVDRAAALGEGDELFLSKPFSTEEITTRVARALEVPVA
jgi:CheY-like chemotaxis protein